MTKEQATGPAPVTGPDQSQQAGDIHNRWWWVEPSVWTERMLTRLETNEPTTVWFRLWDKVIAERNLQAAFWAVWRNEGAPGVDGQTVKQFNEREEVELAKLREELRNRRYRRLEDQKPLTGQRVKRVGDRSPSRRLMGVECSLPGVFPPCATGQWKRR